MSDPGGGSTVRRFDFYRFAPWLIRAAAVAMLAVAGVLLGASAYIVLTKPTPPDGTSGMVACGVAGALAGLTIGILLALPKTGQIQRNRRVITAVILVALGCITFLAQVDALLAVSHPVAQPSYTATSIAGSEDPEGVVNIWRAADEDAETRGLPYRNPPSLVLMYVIADLLFALAYTTLIWVVYEATRNLFRNSDDSSPLATRVKTVSEVLRFFAGGAILLLAVDWLETSAILLTVQGHWYGSAGSLLPTAQTVMRFASSAKWPLLALLIAPLVIALPLVLQLHAERVRDMLRAALRLRLQLFAVIAFSGALLLERDQVPDIIRRWQDDPRDGVFAAIGALILALVIWLSGRHLLKPTTLTASRWRREPRLFIAAGVAVAAIAMWVDWWGVLIPLGLSALIFLLSAPLRIEGSQPSDHGKFPRLPFVLGLLVPAAFGLAIDRAMFAELLSVDELPGDTLVIAVLGAAFVAWSIIHIRHGPGHDADFFKQMLWPSVAFVVLMVGGFIVARFRGFQLANALGSVAIVACFLIAIVGIWSLMIVFTDTFPLPALFRAIGLRHYPVLTVVLIWSLVAFTFDTSGFHHVRTKPFDASLSAKATGDLETLWRRWLASNCLTTPAAASADSHRDGVPLVLIANSGGGIRAAFWTSMVLGDVLGPQQADVKCGNKKVPRSQRVFALSGISGGSLGIVTYATRELVSPDPSLGSDEWTDQRLGEDYLSPTLAWMLFVEPSQSLFRFDTGEDRASVLEQSWERSWLSLADRDANPLEVGMKEYAAKTDGPLLMLNGSIVDSGCRWNGSVLDAGQELNSEGAESIAPTTCLSLDAFERTRAGSGRERFTLPVTVDLVDMLCTDEDIRFSTAALLSARFPFVSPSGRLEECSKGGRLGERNPAVAAMVDGGYLDSSATSPLVELWAALGPLVQKYNNTSKTHCVVPFFVQVDNGYELSTISPPGRRPLEPLVPLNANSTAGAIAPTHARQAAALAFDRGFEAAGLHAHLVGQEFDGPLLDRYARIVPRAHPGVQAPLGWALSTSAKRNLVEQYEQQFGGLEGDPHSQTLPRRDLGQIDDWFDGTLTCR